MSDGWAEMTLGEIAEVNPETTKGMPPQQHIRYIDLSAVSGDSGIPESYKVLLKEMQSLCLNVEVLSSDGQAIEMKESDDDVFRAAEELGIDLSRREPSSVEEV